MHQTFYSNRFWRGVYSFLFLQFEERRYEGGKNWACVKKQIDSNNSDRGMFMKLFRYISGANVGENKIKMTTPVSMKMKGNKNSFEKEMCFYLDSTHQANPPQPTNSDVYIVNRPAMSIYTRFVQRQ